MCLLPSLDDIYVCVEILEYDVWEAEDDKTGFFSVVVDDSDQFFSKTTNILSHGAN